MIIIRSKTPIIKPIVIINLVVPEIVWSSQPSGQFWPSKLLFSNLEDESVIILPWAKAQNSTKVITRKIFIFWMTYSFELDFSLVGIYSYVNLQFTFRPQWWNVRFLNSVKSGVFLSWSMILNSIMCSFFDQEILFKEKLVKKNIS